MIDKHGFAPLGSATGAVKSAIFGYNSARLYKLDLRAELPAVARDKFAVERLNGTPRRIATGTVIKPIGARAMSTAV
jgi:hypothetical protein